MKEAAVLLQGGIHGVGVMIDIVTITLDEEKMNRIIVHVVGVRGIIVRGDRLLNILALTKRRLKNGGEVGVLTLSMSITSATEKATATRLHPSDHDCPHLHVGASPLPGRLNPMVTPTPRRKEPLVWLQCLAMRLP